MQMRIWVLGGGSIGLLFAAKLRASGAETVLITRSQQQAEAICETGIQVFSQDGEQQQITCDAISFEQSATQLADSALPDWILLTVKQYAIDDKIISWLRQIAALSPNTKLLTMQNGIGHLELLLNGYPGERIFGAIVSEGALRTSSIRVEHTGSGVTRLGTATGSIEQDQKRQQMMTQLQKVLQDAGFRCVLSNNLNRDVWNKLIINSVINPLTTLLGIRNGVLLHSDSLMQTMRRLYEEAVAVAARSGVETDEALWDALLEVCRRTADNRSSMLQDLLAGRPTELSWINGAIVRKGHQLGLKVPAHEMILELIQAKEDIH